MSQFQTSTQGREMADQGRLPSPYAGDANMAQADDPRRRRNPPDTQPNNPSPVPDPLPDSDPPDTQPSNPLPEPDAPRQSSVSYADGNRRAKPVGEVASETKRPLVEASFDLPGGRTGVIHQGENVGESFRQMRGQPADLPRPDADGNMNHKVSQGETIASIAQRYDMTSEQILRANNLPADATAADLDGRNLVLPGGSPQRQDTPLPPAQEPTSQSTDTPRPAQDAGTPSAESAATEQQEAVESSPGRPPIDYQSHGRGHERADKRAALIEEAGLREEVKELNEISRKARIPQMNRSGTQEAVARSTRGAVGSAVTSSNIRTAQTVKEVQKTTEIIRGRIDDLNSQMASLERNIMSGMSISKQADQARIAELADRAKREQQLLDQAEKLLKKFNQ